jgi:glyoxylase-like metal-dependent hydrolase (beta-lactamase superfamily II)
LRFQEIGIRIALGAKRASVPHREKIGDNDRTGGNMRRIILALILMLISTAWMVMSQGRGGQARPLEITQIRGDLYYVSGSANTVFLVTPEGIILADPVSTQQATWLKPELDRRFNKPVRYIIYSHHDFDHAEGGAVFGPAAQVIAHENVAKNLDGKLHRLAGGNVDRNNNGRLDRDEASGGYLTNFDRLDRNHDGAITPDELNQEIRKPDITYTGRRTLTLGGKTVELIYPGRNHSDDMTVVYFPAERAVLAVDFIFPGTTPPVWGEYDWTPLREWIASIKTVEALDFDTLIAGHGARLGTKADAVSNREFLEDLSAAVSKGMAEGKSLDELKRTITLQKYAKWPNLATALPTNIEEAYKNLRDYPR